MAGISAGAANASTVTGGTGSFTVPFSYLGQLHGQNIVAETTGVQSVTCDQTNKTVTAVYSVTGGTADLTNLTGTVQYSGSITVKNGENDKQVQLGSLQFDMFNGQIDVTPAGGSQIAILDVGGSVSGSINGTTQTFNASKLLVDPAGASYLDSALGTTAFHAGDVIGSFSTTYTAS